MLYHFFSFKRSIMAGVSPAIQAWSINTSIIQLRSMMNRMTITNDHIRRFDIVSHCKLQMMYGMAYIVFIFRLFDFIMVMSWYFIVNTLDI